MSWYLIVLLIVFYIIMWIITAIAFSRWAKSSDDGYFVMGALWPLVAMCIPLAVVVLFVKEIVDKYGYKKEDG